MKSLSKFEQTSVRGKWFELLNDLNHSVLHAPTNVEVERYTPGTHLVYDKYKL
jgi:hypothetical protein